MRVKSPDTGTPALRSRRKPTASAASPAGAQLQSGSSSSAQMRSARSIGGRALIAANRPRASLVLPVEIARRRPGVGVEELRRDRTLVAAALLRLLPGMGEDRGRRRRDRGSRGTPGCAGGQGRRWPARPQRRRASRLQPYCAFMGMPAFLPLPTGEGGRAAAGVCVRTIRTTRELCVHASGRISLCALPRAAPHPATRNASPTSPRWGEVQRRKRHHRPHPCT